MHGLHGTQAKNPCMVPYGTLAFGFKRYILASASGKNSRESGKNREELKPLNVKHLGPKSRKKHSNSEFVL